MVPRIRLRVACAHEEGGFEMSNLDDLQKLERFLSGALDILLAVVTVASVMLLAFMVYKVSR